MTGDHGVAGLRDGDALLRVRDLRKHFPVRRGVLGGRSGAVRAVDGVSFDVRAGETLGLVGESGCGKSTTARLVTRLLEPTGGTVELDGQDVTSLGRRRSGAFRRDVAMVFQDPYSSLNPRQTVGTIVGAGLRIQKVRTERGVRREVQDLLDRVGLDLESYVRYPHELSGGQRQRVGIARALATRPRLVVCDEPVSALDVSVQAQVVNLLDDLQSELGLAYVLIAHDLAVVRHSSDRVAVMYLGRVVEIGDRDDVHERPQHPYTNALLAAVPVPDPVVARARERVLLAGEAPSPVDPPSGCAFRTRCPRAQPVCAEVVPPLAATDPARPEHLTACHFPGTDEPVVGSRSSAR